jgi:hypothetical protein
MFAAGGLWRNFFLSQLIHCRKISRGGSWCTVVNKFSCDRSNGTARKYEFSGYNMIKSPVLPLHVAKYLWIPDES